MKRRMYLSSIALMLAGCTGPDSEGQRENRQSGGGEGGRGESEWFWLQMEAVSAADIAKRTYNEVNRQPLKRAISEGSATHKTTEPPAVEPDDSYRVWDDGTVYTVSSQLVGESGVTSYVYTVELDPAEEGVEDEAMISFRDLPAADRAELSAEGFENVSAESDLGYGFFLEYDPEDRNKSLLVPTPERSVIRWESGVQGQLQVVDTSKEQTKTYRYDAMVVGSLSEVGNQLLSKHAFSLEGLSTAQREIVQETIESTDGYVVEREKMAQSILLQRPFKGSTTASRRKLTCG